MADLICVSARDELEILPSVKNFLSFADKVILARHPASSLITLKHENLVQFHGDESYLKRLWAALELSTSSSVFIAADDDFYIPSSANSVSAVADKFINCSSVSAITLQASSLNNSRITLKPYLVSSEILKSPSHSIGFQALEERILNYFSPLVVDFYTLYNSEKLKSVINMFLNELSPASLNFIGTSLKLFQYLFSLSLVFVGDAVPLSSPLYVRGVERAIRNQSSYLDNVVQQDDLKPISVEVQQFLGNLPALTDFCNCLFNLFQKNSLSQSKYLDISEVSPKYIYKILIRILTITLEQLKLKTPSYYLPQYEIQVERHMCKPSLNKVNNDLSFVVSYPHLIQTPFPSYSYKIFTPFLLAPEYLHDLHSLCASIWEPYPKD